MYQMLVPNICNEIVGRVVSCFFYAKMFLMISGYGQLHGDMYSIQHYVIKIVSDFCQVGGFLWLLRFPPPIKLTATIYN